MIASVTGRVVSIGADRCVLQLGADGAGIGVLVYAHPGVLAGLRPGESATVATSLVVREDSLTLFGFSNADERDLFELLQSASGVGPKLAQAALSVLPPADLVQAITTENLGALCKVPGIGRKGAQRIVLELKEKMAAVGAGMDAGEPGATADSSGSTEMWADQVQSGLVGLGWSAKDAAVAVEAVEPMAAEQRAEGQIQVAVLMRAALRSLSR